MDYGLFKNYGSGASGGYLSCSGKKDTKEAGQRGTPELPLATPFPFGIPQALLFRREEYFGFLSCKMQKPQVTTRGSCKKKRGKEK